MTTKSSAHWNSARVELAIGPRALHLLVHRLGREAAADGDRHQVLDQDVERLVVGRALLDPAGERRAPRRDRLDQLERVGRHERDPAGAAGRVAAAAGALQQARDAFRRADLQHALDRQEVDAEVERRGRDDRLQAPFLEAELDPVAHFLVERAVVERDDAGPVGPRVEDELVPGLGLRAHVDEDQRRRRALDLLDDRAAASACRGGRPTRSGPGFAGSSVSMTRFLSIRPRTATPRSSPSSTCIASSRLPSVADRPQTTRPGFQRFRRASASCTWTPRLLPISSCHSSTMTVWIAASSSLRGLARQHQAQRFGRRHERGRKAPVLPGALGRRACRRCERRSTTTGRARRAAPASLAPSRRRARASASARGRRAAARWRPASGTPQRGGARERAEPDRVGLARAGGRVQQAALPRRHRRPDLALEGERLPAARREPGFGTRRPPLRTPCAHADVAGIRPSFATPACGARRSSSAASPRCRARRSRRRPTDSTSATIVAAMSGARPWFIAYAR